MLRRVRHRIRRRVGSGRGIIPAAVAGAIVSCGILALLAGVPACRPREPDDPSLRMALRVRPDPPVVGVATIELDMTDATGAAVRGAVVTIEGNMTHPGMASRFATAREAGPGTYRADLELTMAGDWVLLVNARLAGGRTIRRRLALPGVLGG